MMTALGELLQLLASGILGLFVGALLAEGALLIPYWRSLPAQQSLSLYKEYGPRLYRFFAPLTVMATSLMLAAALFRCEIRCGQPERGRIAAGVAALGSRHWVRVVVGVVAFAALLCSLREMI